MTGKACVLVYGSGGRDHCLVEEYAESQYVEKAYIAPGNPGIAQTGWAKKGRIECLPVFRDIEESGFLEAAKQLVTFCKENHIDFVDVGSENPLDMGLADVLAESGIPCIGPKKEYVRIENDRDFTKREILIPAGVPIAEYRSFTDPKQAMSYVRDVGYRVVVKANGLAAGKGAIVCDDVREARDAVTRIMVDREFGESGKKVVIEERMYGSEISFFVYLDGKSILPLNMFVQDYKPAFDDPSAFVDPEDKLEQKLDMFIFQYGEDYTGIMRGLHKLRKNPDMETARKLKRMRKEERSKWLYEYLMHVLNTTETSLPNPNTGGMGCYCPHELVKPSLTNRIIREIVNPSVDRIYNKLGWPYKGVLYFGLNLDEWGNLQVFEINVRHGDPEWEVLGRKMKTDIYEIARAVSDGRLTEIDEVEWNPRHYIDVIASVGRSRDEKGGWYFGYPKRYGEGYRIEGLDKIERGIAVFYSGVDRHKSRGLVTKGGRVLHIVAGSDSLEDAIKKAYRNIEMIRFIDHNNENTNCVRYRKTIGRKRV